MRIIGGMFRGKKLDWVVGEETRPTTDRVKENIFNVLASSGVEFHGAKVLDLFAGSGQMGIECLSRGASRVIFNDTSVEARTVMKKNLTAIGVRGKIVALHYMECLGGLAGLKFDIVFLDPPFSDPDAVAKATRYLLRHELLAKNAMVVCETEATDMEFPGYDAWVKKYGRAVVYFLRPNSVDASSYV